MLRVATLAAALAALVGVQAASGSRPAATSSPTTHNPYTFTDPTGDSGGAPDISGVAVGNTAAGEIRFEISIANAPTLLRDNDFVGVFIDADRNPSTGFAGGFEYSIQTAGTELLLARWGSSGYERVSAPSLIKIWVSGGKMTLRVSSADLGNTTGFAFWAATEVLPGSGDFDDLAPDGTAVYNYTLSIPHIAGIRARFSPTAPRAGRRFGVTGVTVSLETTEEIPATGFRCRATVGGKVLRGTGVGGCTFSIPRSAKGKRLAIAITATVPGESRTLTSSFRIR